jgi:hypothetical protein
MPRLNETADDVDRQHRRQQEGQHLAVEHQPAAIDAVDECATGRRHDEERQAGRTGHDTDEPG